MENLIKMHCRIWYSGFLQKEFFYKKARTVMDKRLIGVLGEKLVCKWYTDHKYKLLSLNYKTRFGEIDVIASNKNTIVFVEVKPEKTINFHMRKKRLLIQSSKR